MRPTVSLRRALTDPRLLGHAFVGESWTPWRILLIAAMGEELTDAERVIFKQITGRDQEPGQRVNELVAVVGRRGGKSRAMAVLMAYVAALCDHTDVLVKGETGVALCVALDQKVAGIVREHCAAVLEESPILKQLIANRTQDTIQLTNGLSIEVRPASFRKLRGPTYVCVVAHELAIDPDMQISRIRLSDKTSRLHPRHVIWYQDSTYANPDVEILAAVRPGLLTTRGLLVLASSPYTKRGVLWDRYRRHYGPDGAPAILVAHGTSRDFNPTLPQEEIDRALEEDRARNSAEYLAQFRSDLEGFVSLEVVEGCVGGYHEMAPSSGTHYCAFVDPSGGSEDSMTMAIAYKTPKPDEQIKVVAVREARPPFSPSAVVDDFAALLQRYRISKVVGDHYGGEFVKEPFRNHGISYEVAKQSKSDLYRDLLPLLNSGRITLPRHDRLVSQIVGLERRVTRAGKDSIDHGPHGHDDIANAVSGVVGAISGVGAFDFEFWHDDRAWSGGAPSSDELLWFLRR